MKFKLGIALFTLLFAFSFAPNALAAKGEGFSGELSFMLGYTKSDFGNNTYSSSRRIMTAVGYMLTPVTELELSFTDTKSFFNYDPIQTTLVREQALSISIIQSIVPSEWLVQPYVKGGAAQYNRKQSGTVSGIPTVPSSTKSPSAVIGGGVRVFLLRNFSLKIEGVSYLPDMKFADARKNFSVTAGLGWHF